ncbi:hypothetical protein ACSBR2_038825 [Camellia fascicularis]
MECSSKLYLGTFITLFLVVLVFQSYESLGCMEEERIGLLKLKDAFKNRLFFSSWGGEESDCCRWRKVKCDNTTKRVIKLSLSSKLQPQQINSSLNASLFLPFTELQVLTLSWNGLKGFQGVLRLNKLQDLNLHQNEFTELPSLGGLPSLTSLDLVSNFLGNSNNFEELTTLSNLEVLKLGNNSITSEIATSFATSIASLTSLKTLSLADNKLNGLWPVEGMCKLKNLEELDLSACGLEGKLPSCLCNLTSIRSLELAKNNFRGTIPSTVFFSLKSLEYVSLSENLFEGLFSFSSLANNSKLVVFKLASYNNLLRVETEIPRMFLTFQLKVLHLSNCTLNEPHGTIPSFLLNQYDLKAVDLGYNKMRGKFPSWLLANNTGLEFLCLKANFFSGPLDFHPNSYNVNMTVLDASNNVLDGQLPSYIGSVLPNLYFLKISKNVLHGNIPSSLGDIRGLFYLDLSHNKLYGQVPEHLASGCKSLTILRLSYNNLHGQILPINANLAKLQFLYSDNNNFAGELSPGLLNSSKLEVLDISNNGVFGKIPSWIKNFPSLTFLIMSKNSLGGPLPIEFCKLNELRYVDLSHNNIGPTIPPCANMLSLNYLHLQRNDFRGTIPIVLSKASSLVTLDMSDNKLSGEIPKWITSLSNLRILLLKSNNLDGLIPIHLCQLKNISILDLSHNHFSGSIPPCLKDITFGWRRTLDGTFSIRDQNMSSFVSSYKTQLPIKALDYYLGYYTFDETEGVEFLTKSRYETYMGNVLYFMSGIDLSCNNLTGQVPSEIGNLSWIISLNLSYNQLIGAIPMTFSHLKQIQSLDLSHNKLSGQIPSQLIELTFLSFFKVGYNNLSGRTPERRAQFATFDKSSYEGNIFLCGEPLKKSCTNTDHHAPPSSELVADDSFKLMFYWSFGASYTVAFLCSIVFLHLNSYYRSQLVKYIEAHVLSYS